MSHSIINSTATHLTNNVRPSIHSSHLAVIPRNMPEYQCLWFQIGLNFLLHANLRRSIVAIWPAVGCKLGNCWHHCAVSKTTKHAPELETVCRSYGVRAHHHPGLISGYLVGGWGQQQEFLELICLAFTLESSITTMEMLPSLNNFGCFAYQNQLGLPMTLMSSMKADVTILWVKWSLGLVEAS